MATTSKSKNQQVDQAGLAIVADDRVCNNLFVNGVQSGVGGSSSVPAGSALTLNAATYGGKTIQLNTATGSTVTLPASTGSGIVYRFYVSVKATSNNHIVKVANSSDIMVGVVTGTRVDSGNAVLGFATAADSDTITLNRTTTGSVSVGEWLEIRDVATNVWHVSGVLSATGAAFATPFSATV